MKKLVGVLMGIVLFVPIVGSGLLFIFFRDVPWLRKRIIRRLKNIITSKLVKQDLIVMVSELPQNQKEVTGKKLLAQIGCIDAEVKWWIYTFQIKQEEFKELE